MQVNHGILCKARVYRYKGHYFEWHSYCGPLPLRKDGELRKRVPSGFWKAIEGFQKLSDAERAGYMVEDGGCIRF